MQNVKPTPGAGGDHYIPYEEREKGPESTVYFTRDLSAEGLKKIFERVKGRLTGKIGIKLHTGEPDGPNIIPRPWVENLVRQELPDAVIVETNTYYEGGRYTTEDHRRTLETNGWTFCPVDIMDAEGSVPFPVRGGKWFTEVEMGKNLENYDSLLVLTHFKGHSKGGFGGSNKNIGIGCAGGQTGKKAIHTTPGSDDMWDISNEEFMERMTESAKAVGRPLRRKDRLYQRHAQHVGLLRLRRDSRGTGRHPQCRHPRLDRYPGGRRGFGRPRLRDEGRRAPRPRRADGVPPRPPADHLYEGAGDGQ